MMTLGLTRIAPGSVLKPQIHPLHFYLQFLNLLGRVLYDNLCKFHQLFGALHCVEHFNLDFVIV